MYPIAIRKIYLFVLTGLALLPFSAAADDTIYTKVDINPVPVKTPPPEYPNSMRQQGVSGVVAVSVVIDEKGSVISTTVAKSTHADFESPATDAVKKWKFKPAQKDGAPVKMKVTIPIRFNLEE